MLRLVTAFALLCALAAAGQGQIVKKGSAYVFRAQYKKGAKMSYLYETSATSLGGGARMATTITFPVAMVVLETKKQGAGVVAKIKSTAGPWKQNGKVFRSASSVTVQVDQLNRMVGTGSLEIPQFSTPLPEKPLKIGDSWSSTIDASESVPMPLQVTAKYTLLRVSKGIATIQMALSGRGVSGSGIFTQGKGTMRLKTSDGSLEGSDLVQTISTGQGLAAKSVIKVKRTR